MENLVSDAGPARWPYMSGEAGNILRFSLCARGFLHELRSNTILPGPVIAAKAPWGEGAVAGPAMREGANMVTVSGPNT